MSDRDRRRPVNRRRFLRVAGAGGAALLAGCSAEPVDEGATGTPSDADAGSATGTDGSSGATDQGTTVGSDTADTLVVATYSSFIDAPSSSPGAWLKERFESEFDAELIWQTPSGELNYYIQRANAGVGIDADVYVGLNVDSLIRVDQNVENGPLFAEAPSLERGSAITESLQFDPKSRAVPYDTGYICLVWDATADGGEFEAPATFDGLLESEYSNDLIVQNPGTSAPGKAFMLHTIDQYGADGYLDYWKQLQDNGVRVLGKWEDAYNAYSNGEAPMVVSYSTDQVYANRYDQNMDKHQLRFLNDEGYANPEGMAQFAESDAPGLAKRFMEFVLRPEVQGQIAVRNVQFPAVGDATFPDEFSDYEKYAKEPPNSVTFGYDELQGNLEGWISDWQKQVATK
jgi:thiamine transport system substrate-binding protein